MPPDDNNVEAKDLTPEELGLLAAWIDQGADRRRRRRRGAGQMASAAQRGAADLRRGCLARRTNCRLHARGNQIFLYHLPSGQLAAPVGRSRIEQDRSVRRAGRGPFRPGPVAGLQSRWRSAGLGRVSRSRSSGARLQETVRPAQALPQDATGALALSPDGKRPPIGDAKGRSPFGTWPRSNRSKRSPATPARSRRWHSAGPTSLVSGSADQSIRLWKLADGSQLAVDHHARPGDGRWRWCKGGSGSSPARPTTSCGFGSRRAIRPSADRLDQFARISKGITARSRPWSFRREGPEEVLIFGQCRRHGPRNGRSSRRISTPAARRAKSPLADRSRAWRFVPTACNWPSVGGNLVKLWKIENGQPWTDAANQPLPEMKGDLRAAARAAARKRMVDLSPPNWPTPRRRSPMAKPKSPRPPKPKRRPSPPGRRPKSAGRKGRSGQEGDRGQRSGRQSSWPRSPRWSSRRKMRSSPISKRWKKIRKRRPEKLCWKQAKKLAADTEERRKRAEAAAKPAR